MKDFFTTSQQIDALNNISTKLNNISTGNDIKCARDSLCEILEILKNKCSWTECCNQPIKQVIDSVKDLPEKSVNDMLKTIGTRVDEAQATIASNLLLNSTAFLAITMVTNTIQVIRIYRELKEASNLVQTSREKLEGIITKYINETQDHLTKAGEFLEKNLLNQADTRLNRARHSALKAYTEMNGIEIQCNNQIKTLKTEKIVSVSHGAVTFITSIFQVLTIATTPTAGISTALKVSLYAVAGAGMFLGGGSACYSYYITNNRINELQLILDEIQEKKTELDKLEAKIDELSNWVESKRLE